MRDNSLARHLISQGHEVTMLPTYLPHLLDEERCEFQESDFFGRDQCLFTAQVPHLSQDPQMVGLLVQ